MAEVIILGLICGGGLLAVLIGCVIAAVATSDRHTWDLPWQKWKDGRF